MGYTSTFLRVAEDCRAVTGEVPKPRAAGPTVAGVQFAMLSAEPGRHTQEDVLFASCPEVRGGGLRDEERQALRDAFSEEGRACLRASPLPKSHGWGLHFDADGRITLHAVDSPEYARLSADPALTQLRAMRSRRAVG